MKTTQKLRLSFLYDRDFFSWKTIFSYRNLWMFLAMVGIILYHSPYNPFSGKLMSFFCRYCYGGVDVFLFSSGIGCYFSFQKDPDILHFLRRRAQRILPIFLMSLMVWTIFCNAVSGITLSQFIGNIFGHGTLANQDNQLNWYFACLWVCYFSVPFFVALAENYTSALSQEIIILLLSLFSIPFFGQWPLILWSRIPVFFLGICTAQRSTRKSSLSLGEFFFSQLGIVIGLLILEFLCKNHENWLWSYGAWWYPFILITPGLCILVSIIASFLDRTPFRVVLKLCIQSGNYTLSLSLTHVIIFAAYRILLTDNEIQNNWFSFCIALFLTVAFSACLQIWDTLFQRLWQKKNTPVF